MECTASSEWPYATAGKLEQRQQRGKLHAVRPDSGPSPETKRLSPRIEAALRILLDLSANQLND
ncbi:MAG: hypothetical protein M1828_004995 [Chrysothrix sp. TS-e1954]|nr:MAG: hypothetical protein M1828_004995 [Chrysothrix sp. TS-e1954]